MAFANALGKIKTSRILSDEEKRKALLIISEMKSRGIEIPPGLQIQDSKDDSGWNQDENGYFIKRDGKRFKPRPVLEDFINDSSRFILLKSGRGGGKALWVNTPILTHNRGWTTMGDIQEGDYVYNEHGNPVKVLFKSSVMYNHKCYKVTFSDGTEIVADAEHLWTVTVKEYSRNWKTVTDTTENLSKSVKRKNGEQARNYINVCSPLHYEEKSLPIHPYVLGVWLGDGSSRDCRITVSPDDHEIVELIEECGYPLHKVYDQYTWSFEYKGKSNTGMKSKLVSLNVWKNKHIPEEYLRAGVFQRLDLLQGLMDTDGTISKRGHCSFDNKNFDLILDVYELISSLGMKSTIHKYEIDGFDTPTWSYKIAFTPTLPVFKLSRKLNRIKKTEPRADVFSRAIVSIVEVPSVPVRCIEVDSPSHLFLVTNSFIATHNTTSAAQKVLFRVKDGFSGAVMSPDFENFRTSTWPELREWIPWNKVVPKHRYRASADWEPIRPFTIVFVNGARLYCKGLKDPESARGANLNFFWYDEGRRDPTGLGWKNAVAFLRVGEMPQAFCTTTMASLDHWTNTFFQGKVSGELAKIIEELRASGIEQNMFSIHKTSTKENAENLDPMFYASLVSTYPSGYLRQREIDGEAADEGGSLGTREWFEGKGLQELPDWAVKFVRFWDLAGTEKKILKGKKLNDPDESVGSLLGTDKERDITKKKYVIADQVGGHLVWKKLKEFILDATRRDVEKLGMVTVCFEQEPASGGKNQVAELKEFLETELQKRWGIGRNQVKITSLEAKKLGDRVLAANTWFSEANNGQFYYVEGLWTEKFFGQLDTFDGIKHDDRITSVTGARHEIAPIQKKFGKVEFLSL